MTVSHAARWLVALTAIVIAVAVPSAGARAVPVHCAAVGHYSVAASSKTTCTLARKWVPKLVTQTTSAAKSYALKGPSGYACTAPLVGSGKATRGTCVRTGSSTRTAFTWTRR